ncbi:hypothetical protein [Brevundimonas sp.]|uniref:hypothetical protein n=1 Tax=Brevundimonas sp. TaxID=1871086 RepID=UPI0025C0DCB1|nr:hypothetical protein [Brevundimonas sp.]
MPAKGMNCLGREGRDAGHSRVPEPPHMMTGKMTDIGAALILVGVMSGLGELNAFVTWVKIQGCYHGNAGL